jgi:hypothetical protein
VGWLAYWRKYRRSGRSRSVFTLSLFFLFYTTLSLLYFITQRTQGLKISCEVIERTREVVNTTRCNGVALRHFLTDILLLSSLPPHLTRPLSLVTSPPFAEFLRS